MLASILPIIFNVIFAISATSLIKWSLVNNNNVYGIISAFFLNACSFSLYLKMLKSNSLATTQISILSLCGSSLLRLSICMYNQRFLHILQLWVDREVGIVLLSGSGKADHIGPPGQGQ